MKQRKSDVYLCYNSTEVRLSAQQRLGGRRADPAAGRGCYSRRRCRGTGVPPCTLVQNTMTKLQAGRWELDKIGGNSKWFCNLSMDSTDSWETHGYLLLANTAMPETAPLRYGRTSPVQNVLAFCRFSFNHFPLSLVKSPFLANIPVFIWSWLFFIRQ